MLFLEEFHLHSNSVILIGTKGLSLGRAGIFLVGDLEIHLRLPCKPLPNFMMKLHQTRPDSITRIHNRNPQPLNNLARNVCCVQFPDFKKLHFYKVFKTRRLDQRGHLDHLGAGWQKLIAEKVLVLTGSKTWNFRFTNSLGFSPPKHPSWLVLGVHSHPQKINGKKTWENPNLLWLSIPGGSSSDAMFRTTGIGRLRKASSISWRWKLTLNSWFCGRNQIAMASQKRTKRITDLVMLSLEFWNIFLKPSILGGQ